MILPKGWRIVAMRNKGLDHPNDGHKTKRVTWRVYAPGSDVGVEEFNTQREAIAFVKRMTQELVAMMTVKPRINDSAGPSTLNTIIAVKDSSCAGWSIVLAFRSRQKEFVIWAVENSCEKPLDPDHTLHFANAQSGDYFPELVDAVEAFKERC